MKADELLLKIARCKSATHYLNETDENHPCSKIIDVQQTRSIDNYCLPEPWSGELSTARMLFLSSNPSIGAVPVQSPTEVYPTGSWKDESIIEFFNGRFGSRGNAYIKDGIYSLVDDGSYSRHVPFWSGVRARAREAYNREVVPGVDYALTEIVHCKSAGEQGVPQAKQHCTELYLKDVLECSGARLIVVLGVVAKDSFHNCYPDLFSDKGTFFGPLEIAGRTRLVIFSPHPTSGETRQFPLILSEDELTSVRNCLS